jgi:ABC-2 type transport system permease protein
MTATATGHQPSVGFANIVRSEWTKLRSVRSTYWTAIVTVLATVTLGAIVCARWAQVFTERKDDSEGFDATLTSLTGFYVAQVAIGALGVLVISSEYGTGMIRATLGAVPQRREMLAAKALVLTLSTVIVGEVLSFASFGIGQALLHRAHVGASLGDPGVLRAVSGAGLYLGACGLLGFGLGALIRHTAGGLSAFFGVLFASTAVVDLLPTTWRNHAIKYMPVNAGSQLISVVPNHNALSPWAGFGVFCLYAAAALVVAMVLITHRDA